MKGSLISAILRSSATVSAARKSDGQYTQCLYFHPCFTRSLRAIRNSSKRRKVVSRLTPPMQYQLSPCEHMLLSQLPSRYRALNKVLDLDL